MAKSPAQQPPSLPLSASSSSVAPFRLQTTLALHPTPSAHEAMRLQLDQGQVTPPRPFSIQGLPAAEGLGAEGALEGPGP